MKSLLFFAVILLIDFTVHAATNCSSEFTRYQKRWSLQSEKWGAAIRPGNEAQFKIKKGQRAALLIHGYGGSPFEMSFVASALGESGISTLSMLIPGFGSTARVANKATLEHWRLAVDQAVDLLSSCYDGLVLVGFSTGGTLVTDYVLRHNNKKISHIILLSPYFKFRSFWQQITSSAISPYGAVDVKWAWQWTQHPDLLPFILYPDFYNQELPLLAGEVVKSLSEEISRGSAKTGKLKIPVYAVQTESDQTSNVFFAEELLRTLFHRPRFLTYGQQHNIAHHVMLPLNPKLDRMLVNIQEFIADGTSSYR